MAGQNQCSRKADTYIRMDEKKVTDFSIAHGIIKKSITVPRVGLH